jgi:hypothetical protein
MSPTLLGIAPYAGVNFATFEFLKTLVPKKVDANGNESISIPMKLLCGGLAGAFGQTGTDLYHYGTDNCLQWLIHWMLLEDRCKLLDFLTAMG